MSGKQLRLGRVFQADGRALVLAIDHGIGMGPLPGLAQPADTIARVIEGGVDGVLTTPGIALRFPGLFTKTGLIVRLDGAFTTHSGIGAVDRVQSVEAAIRIGADVVGCMGYVGGDAETRTLKYLGAFAEECEKWQIPLMAEMLHMGNNDQSGTAEQIALAARTGAEYGADFIKTTYSGSAESFRPVVDGCFRPILVLGGSKQKDLDLLRMVENAMQAGAAGAAIGRNIWQHPSPTAITQALVWIIHENMPAQEAYHKSGLDLERTIQ